MLLVTERHSCADAILADAVLILRRVIAASPDNYTAYTNQLPRCINSGEALPRGSTRYEWRLNSTET